MKITVIEADMTKVGGGQLIALEAIRAFRDVGWDVTLVTAAMGKGVLEAFGTLPKGVEVVEIAPSLRKFRLYKNMIVGVYGEVIDSDVVFNVYGTYPFWPPSGKVLVYIHFPFKVYDRAPRNPLWRLYASPQALNEALRRLSLKRRIYLTNSRFTAWAFIRRRGSAPIYVLYPPVKPLRPSKTKEDIIVSLGRISPEKNQLEQLLIAKVMREKGMKFDLFIMGSLDKSSRKCMQYYELLMRKMSAWNLKGRVEILANVSRRDMEEIVGRAKVMLHTYKFHLKDLGTIGEHFGIAVAECMSAGAIPIVPAVPSGVWWDILERGRYGYGYHSIAECASKIGMIIKSWSDHELLSRECIRRAGMYSFERFRKEIVKVVRKVSEEAKYISEPQRFSMSVSIGV